ncbi:hypothetical protein EV127DRAFT_403795 [Xylaria flabelliformis]|nr:hypothetical protein EV127DRAFT_403795 [Xylaria flabelliformis]
MFQAYSNRQQLPQPGGLLPHYTFPTTNSLARRRRAWKSTSPSESSSSTLCLSQPRSCPPKSTRRYYPCVADTNPERTARLWKTIFSHLKETEKPSYLRETANSVRSKQNTILPVPTGVKDGIAGPQSTTGTVKSTRTTGSTTAETCFTGIETAAKVTDPDFETSVLERYGVTIVPFEVPIDPKPHFGLTGLPDPMRISFHANRILQ